MKAVNLLPPDLRGASKAQPEPTVVTDDSSGAGAYAVLGALALAVLAVAGVVMTGNAVKERETELAEVSARAAQVQSRAAALRPYADFDQLASTRIATVSDLAGSRFDWEQTLRDLSRALPSDVTLSELSGNVSTDAGGGSGSSLRSAIAAPAITLVGCTRSQRGVARLMVRLRNVDGVTRVSLAKSDKTEAAVGGNAGAGSVVPGGSTTAADRMAAPCGQGKRPKFELVMFFERAAAAATAPSATPPAPGTAGAPGQTAAATPATPAPQDAGATSTQTSTGTPQGGTSP